MPIDPDTRQTDVRRGRELRLWTLATVSILGAVLLTPALPDIDLDTGLADATVRLTNTGGGVGLAPLVALGVVLIVSRPGAAIRRRREASVLALVILVALIGGALANEFVVKPAFGIPRPNIEALAQEGVLGPDIDNGADFYATGNKAERRRLLADQLTADTVPYLSGAVRAHWIHEAGHSFPSGHATASMTVAAVLTLAGILRLDGWRRWIALVAVPLWAVAVVYSRPLLEVHRPIDVIVGTLSGLLLGLVAFAIAQRVAWGPGATIFEREADARTEP